MYIYFLSTINARILVSEQHKCSVNAYDSESLKKSGDDRSVMGKKEPMSKASSTNFFYYKKKE